VLSLTTDEKGNELCEGLMVCC